MGFWNTLFGKKNPTTDNPQPESNPLPQPHPDIDFGHYSDVNKSEESLKKWHEAADRFKENDYLSSLTALLHYLNNTKGDAVEVRNLGSRLEFTLFQGSAEITGLFDGEFIQAECILASFEHAPIAAMNRLLNDNYVLRYTKFAVNENHLGLFFRSPVKESSPDKLYHGFREMCLKSDQYDDLLHHEFEGIHKPTRRNETIRKIPAAEAEVKWETWNTWLSQTLDFVRKQDRETYSGIITYSLLNFMYKCDYLLGAQGNLLNELNRIQYIYWNKNDGLTNIEKNEEIISELTRLANESKDFFTGCFYRVRSVFGLVTATEIGTIREYMAECLKNTDWYVQNKQPEMELIIYEYTITYSLFHFGLFPAHYRLFHLQLMILNSDYFIKLGFKVPYIQNGIINREALSEEIRHIISEESKQFPDMAFQIQNLNFDSLPDFHYSFLQEIRALHFSPKT
jgi:hypothetical protein